MKKAIFAFLILAFLVLLNDEISAQEPGACCLGGYCITTVWQDWCDSLGGNWYEGEDCQEFSCPGILVGQPPNWENGIFSDVDCDFCGGVQILAENFRVYGNLGNRIGGLTFWGGYYPSNYAQGPDCFEVVFRDDADGVPGDEIARVSCRPGVRMPASMWSHSYLYFIDLSGEDIILPTFSRTVFVELYNNTEGNDDSWFWEVGDVDPAYGVAGQAYTFTLPEEPWEYDHYTDLSFFLSRIPDTTGADDTSDGIPGVPCLSQNYPNPFNASTVIGYSLPSASDVTIDIYDLLGRKVEALVVGRQQAGNHQIIWDASEYSSGLYFYRIRAGAHNETRKMVLSK